MSSNTTRDFWKLFDGLPNDIRKKAVRAYKTWRTNPRHPGLYFKSIHRIEPIYSVRISRGYRALGLKENDVITWFWIGSHAEYEKLISRI